MFETWKNPDNRKLFEEAAGIYGIEIRGVPTTFVGEKHWVGYSDRIREEMEDYIIQCLENGCENTLSVLDFE